MLEKNRLLSLIIPTMWYSNGYLLPMLGRYAAHSRVGEIIIIDNRPECRPRLIDSVRKVRMLGKGRNIYVNPAWNLGVENARCDGVVILNDDLLFDCSRLLGFLEDSIQPGMIVGPSEACTKRNEKGSLRLLPSLRMGHGFGYCMALRRESYKPIPEGLNVWAGDNYLHRYLDAYEFAGEPIQSPGRNTTSRLQLRGVHRRESELYKRIIQNGE